MSFSPVAGAAKKAGLSTLQRVVLGGLVVTLAGSAMLRAYRVWYCRQHL